MRYPNVECFPLDGKDEPCPFSLAPNGTFAIGYGYNEEETVPGGTTYYGDDQIEYFEIEIPDHHKGEDGEGPCIGGWDYIMFANEGKRLQGTTHNSAIAIDVETRTLIYVAEGVEGHSAWTQYGQQFTHSSPYLTIRSATIGEIIRKFPGHMDASELIEIEKTIPAELNIADIQDQKHFFGDLSWIEGRVGREEQFLAILKKSVTRQKFQQIAYVGLLNGSKNEKNREIVFAKLTQTVDTFLALAHASHAMANQSSTVTYFEKAAALASKNDEPNDKLRRVMRSQLEVDDLAGAYRTWRRVVPSHRNGSVRSF